MLIPYEARNFGSHWGTALSGNHDLQCTWSKIIWAAVTVGRKNWRDAWIHGNYSVFEAIYRVFMIYANLMEQNDYIKQSPAFNHLDPSEKSAISYFFGLITSKLFTEKCFNVPWLMHLDVYRDELSPTVVGKRKSDLVGHNRRGEWVVVEAKGRSRGFDSIAQDKGKRQTSVVRKVSGDYPILRSVIQSYFYRDNLSLKVDDPDGSEEEGLDIEIAPDTFIRNYYSLVMDILHGGEGPKRTTIKEQPFVVAGLKEVDMSVGLREPFYDILIKKQVDKILLSETFMHEFRVSESDTIDKTKDDLSYIGNDGILVKCGSSWKHELMSKPPEKRSLGDDKNSQ